MFAEKTSDGVDRLTEIVFLYNGVRPDRRKKFFFRNEFAAIADEINEGLKRLFGKRAARATVATFDPPLNDVESKLAELILLAASSFHTRKKNRKKPSPEPKDATLGPQRKFACLKRLMAARVDAYSLSPSGIRNNEFVGRYSCAPARDLKTKRTFGPEGENS